MLKEIGPNKIIAVVCTRGVIFAKTIKSLQSNGIDGFLVIDSLGIPDAQNEAVKEALKTECTHIWFVEDDMEFMSGTLQKLLDTQAPIACADYPVDNGYSTIHREGELIKNCGLGCTLINRDVFEKLDYPWFRTDKSISAKDGSVLDQPYKYGGQDIWFGRMAREAGYTIKQTEGLEVSHLRCAELSRNENNNGCYQIRPLPPVSKWQ